MTIQFTLDGKTRFAGADPGDSALTVLKRLGVDSVRNSDDGHGFAGSDSIMLDGRIVGANLLLAGQLDGRDVKTVASLRTGRSISAVQQALVEAGCVQSGYNAPAAALMISDLIERNPAPSRADVQDALSGLFNRATGYEQFFEAVRIAVAKIHGTDYAMPPAPKFGKDARYIGKRSPKVDALRLVAGEKAFVEDRVGEGGLHPEGSAEPSCSCQHPFHRQLRGRGAARSGGRVHPCERTPAPLQPGRSGLPRTLSL